MNQEKTPARKAFESWYIGKLMEAGINETLAIKSAHVHNGLAWQAWQAAIAREQS